jgi:hypothetical protein
VKNDAKPDLAQFIDRWTIEYVRVYPQPIERVWRAITDANEFGVWFIRGEIELTKGGRYRRWSACLYLPDPVISV